MLCVRLCVCVRLRVCKCVCRRVCMYMCVVYVLCEVVMHAYAHCVCIGGELFALLEREGVFLEDAARSVARRASRGGKEREKGGYG